MEDGTAPRIFLRPIGSPLTIGMSALAIASLVQSGSELHWIPKRETVYVGLILLAVPFVMQLLACILSYAARDGAAGAALGVLATSWLAIGLIEIVSRKTQPNSALGLLLLASGGTLGLSAIAVAVAKPLPAIIFLAAATRFALAGIHHLTATSSWNHASGILGLVIVAMAAYAVLAFELEGQQRRPVLPTFRRGRGAMAMAADVRAQLDGVANEAGVRQTT
jgi:succinate-acetate transporter protein